MAACTPPACPALRRCLRRAALSAGLAALSISPIPPALAQGSVEATAGGKGAQTYCFMRSNGNSHAVSWSAAYALIKRQGGSLFKTSPEHAAVMITEAVVQNPNTFPDCGRFLGDLYSRQSAVPSQSSESAPSGSPSGGSPGGLGGMTRSERYGN